MAVKSLRSARPAEITRVATVPSHTVADKYIGRQYHGMTDFEIFDYATQAGLNILIEGPTGPGKTMASRAYAAERNRAFYAIPSNVGIDPTQLFGKYIPNEGAVEGDPLYVWQDGPVTDLVRYGGILLINEVNFMPPRISTAVFSLLDGRREVVLLDHKGEVVRAHMGHDCWCGAADCSDMVLLVIADMNPEYEGTTALNKAFRNRFAIQLVWEYEPAVEIKLVASDALRDIATKIRKQHEAGEIDTPVSTNMMMEFEETVNRLAEQFNLSRALGFAIMNFVNHFGNDERAAIKQVFDTMQANLTSDFTPRAPATVTVKQLGDWDFGDSEDTKWVFDRQ